MIHHSLKADEAPIFKIDSSVAFVPPNLALACLPIYDIEKISKSPILPCLLNLCSRRRFRGWQPSLVAQLEVLFGCNAILIDRFFLVILLTGRIDPLGFIFTIDPSAVFVQGKFLRAQNHHALSNSEIKINFEKTSCLGVLNIEDKVNSPTRGPLVDTLTLDNLSPNRGDMICPLADFEKIFPVYSFSASLLP
ncbi:hypothetical protein N7533_010836 [Penicillium manginii]|uniref:uncharacterized protein n=1 Tax=Penicillium manginii TaxID=203109 RepID=UPI00254688D0|nr:uncharacterized protein N7533_010836 [Penicillium manginii]KAJ5741427.1 hypothetical protein N7533_010836 [Penicillium manginii]